MTDKYAGATALQALWADILEMHDTHGFVQSGSTAHGPLCGVSAKGWSEQDGTPTPESPAPIAVVVGRNLIDAGAASGGKYLDSAGSEQVDASWSVSGYIAVEAGANYAASGFGSVSAKYAAWYDSAKSLLTTSAQSDAAFTLTAPAGAAFVRVSLLDASIGSSQLELGSVPTPYVPCGHVGLEVTSGKNLANPVKEFPGYVLNADGTMSASSGVCVTALSACDGNTSYSVTGKPSSTYNDTIRVGWYDETKSFISRTVASSPSGATVTSPSDARYFRLSYGNSTLASNTISDVQFEKGVATSYEPHHLSTTPIPLPSKGWAGAVGSYADKLSVDSAGRWEWENECAETVFDGSSDENWNTSGTNTSGIYRLCTNALTSTMLKPASASVVHDLLCSMFTKKSADNVYLRNEGISATSDGYVYIYSEDNQVPADWKVFLASNPMELFYPLATPTTEHGYIDLPAIPDGATVSIPELEDVGVGWFVPGASELIAHAFNVLKRANEEAEAAIIEATTE